MQRPKQRSLFGSLLFPSWEETPTRGEISRLILNWILLFPVPMALLTLVWGLIAHASVQKTVLWVCIVFFGASLLFGIQAWFMIQMSNRNSRAQQEQHPREDQR